MIQSFVNHLYRYPLSKLRKYKRFGGYLAYRKMLANAKQMEAAAWQLPTVQCYPDGLPLYFLTGQKYAYQTLFCIQSLQKVTPTHFNFVLIDDGSFSETLVSRLKRKLSGVTIVDNSLIESNLELHLPENRYPVIRAKRLVYPHLKKLTDIHTIPGDPWKLVLDSDMLFWEEPMELINWLKNPLKPIHMIDCAQSYGYSLSLMEKLCEVKITPLINVGAIGLHSSTIDWAKIEQWIEELETKEGASYYLEQTLTAMLIAGTQHIGLDKTDYIVNPRNKKSDSDQDILHHYVDLSKKLYFDQAWRQIATR